MQSAILALENGLTFEGYAFGDCRAEAEGEVVFNTAMSGYQEALTDPSYYGQILTFTYPHIGNYGINAADNESDRLQAAGVIVKENAGRTSNWRSEKSLTSFLESYGVIGIEGIDTRKLVRVLRSEGSMRGIISARESDARTLLSRCEKLPRMDGLDLTGAVTCSTAYTYLPDMNEPLILPAAGAGEGRFKVAAIDFGIKRNILRRLTRHGCEIRVFPAASTASDILAYKPDGVFLSNGPGDPAAVDYAMPTIRTLLEQLPVFGICLGHQLLALAFGAQTYKLKFGHRGVNHPVKNLLANTIEITSQNHGFAVDADSLPPDVELTHVNLNDNTVAGLRHRELPVFCVQYHPEASPGTHDSDYLFRNFVRSLSQAREKIASSA